MNRNYVICCEILRREVEHLLAQSQSPPEACFLRKGYHDNPAVLREEVQKAIDGVPSGFDAILLGYGLCGKGLEGVAARTVPLVVPRVHDCISLLLGSAKAYEEHFSAHPGTYYYSPGWLEWGSDAIDRAPAQGLGLGRSYEEYAAKFGEDNARYLMELEASWAQRYTRAAFIDSGLPDCDRWETQAKEVALSKGWNFERISGSLRLLRLLIEGPGPHQELLLVPPGARIVAALDGSIIRAEQG